MAIIIHLAVLFLPLSLSQNLQAKEKHTKDVGWG